MSALSETSYKQYGCRVIITANTATDSELVRKDIEVGYVKGAVCQLLGLLASVEEG
jgi:hypothetical protein